MVKQRKSKGSDVQQNPSDVTTSELPLSPMKKAKVNGILDEAEVKSSGPMENGKCDSYKEKKVKSHTIGHLAEQHRAETEAKLSQTSSLAVQLTQGLMSNDVLKLDSVLREVRVEIIQATLLDLQVSNVIPLLKALFERINNRSAINIKPWILWIQCILSLHASFLSSIRNLETELSGLLEWMRQRVGHQQKLLELHGRLSIVSEQIERRMNRTVVVTPQPLIVFNDDVDSDLDDAESGGSDESGVSSDEEEEDWWDEGGLGVVDENGDEDDDYPNDDSDVDIPVKNANVDSDGSGIDGDEFENNESEGDDDGGDDDDEMDLG